MRQLAAVVDNVLKPGYSRTGLMNVRIDRALWLFVGI